jgi:acyl-CoA thioesterase FadM
VGVSAERVLDADGYRVVDPIVTSAADFDAQGHLNNAATVRLFYDLRVAYVHGRIGAWWPEGLPGERFTGGMKYVARDGKAAVLEQRIVEATTGRAIARAWVVQLLVQGGKVIDWPTRYFERVAEIEGRVILTRPRSATRAWGPPLDGLDRELSE